MQNIETSSAMSETHKTVTRFELTKIERLVGPCVCATYRNYEVTTNEPSNEPIIEQ